MKTSIRLAIGPANYAGQAFRWAEAATQHLDIHAVSFAHGGPGGGADLFAFPAHYRIGHPRLTAPWARRRLVDTALGDSTHVGIDGFSPLFGIAGFRDLVGDIRKLRSQDRTVFLISHGGDTRDPDAHMERNEYSFYSSAPRIYVDKLRAFSRENRRLVAETGCRLLVSTPDLLLDSPEGSWLPLAVDLEQWHTSRPTLERLVPTVLHLPSKRTPAIKGTELIEPIMTRLDQEGLIQYLSPTNVAHDRMPILVKDADIVIDQLLTGSYGVAAIEAMAAGRLVIGNVGSATRTLLPEDPPILDATPATLEALMRDVVAGPNDFAQLASRGQGYAQRWHSGAASAQALSEVTGYRGEDA